MQPEDEVISMEMPSERDRRVYDGGKSGFRSRLMPVDGKLAERERMKFYTWEAQRKGGLK